jgi:hypothetical protein
MPRVLHPLIAAAALLTLLGGTRPALSQAGFDGSWSVLVVTESGACDRAYRYAVRIDQGVVKYAGQAGIDLSGRVNARGAVNVTVRRGGQSASGQGRMTQRGGSGKWRGGSGSRQCAGYWEAERRSG